MIAFNKVQPTSSGTVTTASDTLTITTDCSAGSNVYISAVNGASSGTSLVNNAAGSNNEISALSGTTIGSTALTLENNTWGFNTTNGDTYYGLPTYANATNHAIYSGTNTTVPIYYGAKVTSSLAPGKYNGQVLYTATVSNSCLFYTISFNKNASDATGSMADQSITPAVSTPLTTSSFERPGYIFLGWSTDPSATTPTYTDGQSVTDLAQGGQFITLYAVWGISMQSYNCANLPVETTSIVYDTRDRQAYTVYRWPNSGIAGKKYPNGMSGICIMTKSLSLGYTTSGSITRGDNLVLTTADSAGNGTITARTSKSNWNTSSVDSNLQYINGQGGDSGSQAYYSYGAALVVCPKGWRLPTSDEYGNIISFAMNGGSVTDGATSLHNTPYNFIYSGNFSSINGNYGVGVTGYYWSSTPSSSDSAYRVAIAAERLEIAGGEQKNVGEVVRCVAEPVYYMQDITADVLLENETTDVVDKRDEQEYTVYRWPSSGTAGVDYPSSMAGYAIMTKSLSLGYTTGGSITRGGNLVLTTTDSAGNGTITARTSTSDWNTNDIDSNLQYINGQGGDNGSQSFYSYGAALVACPKGWRLPTSTEYDNIISFAMNGGSVTDGATLLHNTPYNFLYSGNFSEVYGYYGTGVTGYYRTSTSSSSNNSLAPRLAIAASRLDTGADSKHAGEAVRCVAEPTYYYSMQDVPANGLTEKKTVTMVDKRDEQEYTVYRWPSSGTAGVDYPSSMAGYAIMTKSLGLGYTTSGNITRGGNLTLTTTDSAGNGVITARTGTSDWNATTADSNLQYINGQGGDNGSQSYYSYGAAKIVCPKGWRLPTNTEYNNVINFMKNGGSIADGSTVMQNPPYNFISSGNFGQINGYYGVGTTGYYQTSSQSDIAERNFVLAIRSPDRIETVADIKSTGQAVRCVSTPAPDCSQTVHPTAASGCNMADGKTWIYGNNGNEDYWTNLFNNGSGSYPREGTLKNSSSCPSGYSPAKYSDYQTLIDAQGSGNQLYNAIGLSENRFFWSSTEGDSIGAYYLYASSSSASLSKYYYNNINNYKFYLLCHN